MTLLNSVFTEHPKSAGLNYFQHQRQAFWAVGQLLLAAGAAAVHGLVPALCTRAPGRIVGGVVAEFKGRPGAPN